MLTQKQVEPVQTAMDGRRNALFKINGRWYDLFATIECVVQHEEEGLVHPDICQAVIWHLEAFRRSPGSIRWIPDLKRINYFLEFDLWFEEYGVVTDRS